MTRLPGSVTPSTIHSVARTFVKNKFDYSDHKLTTTPTTHQVAAAFQVRPRDTYLLSGQTSVNGRDYAALINRTCQRFLGSSDDEPHAKHFKREGKLKGLSAEEFAMFAENYVCAVEDLWSEMKRTDSSIPLGHDGYQKLWGLARPTLQKDFILLDEAQDTSDVVLQVLRQQTAQVVYVGDEYQQIYEFRGAVSAMSKVTCQSASLTMSFRFGSGIASAANLVLSKLGCTKSLVGNPEVISKVGENDSQAVLCRGNIGVIDRVMTESLKGRPVHVVGGTKALVALLLEVGALRRGIPSAHPDFFGYADWNDVVEHCEDGDCGYLKILVRLVDRFGEEAILRVLKKTCMQERDAHVTVSTAHKAKGREWERVEVSSDFDRAYIHSEDDLRVDDSEIRLFYVAMTRAKTHVSLPHSACKYFGIAR